MWAVRTRQLAPLRPRLPRTPRRRQLRGRLLETSYPLEQGLVPGSRLSYGPGSGSRTASGAATVATVPWRACLQLQML